MKKILVTGAGGFVGSRVMQQWAGRYELCTFPKGFLATAGEDAVRQAVLQQRPDVILHTAAISDTGYCAGHPEQAYRANVELSVWLARAAAEIGAKLVAFSSDQVYAGVEQSGPLPETIPLKPANVYGQGKLEMEQRVQALCPGAVLLRATWMYDLPGFVGSRVMQQWAGRYELCTFPKGFLATAGEDAVRQAVLQQRPDVILHTAAISDTGYCAGHPEQAYRANVELSVWLARAAAEIGAKLVAFSSDQVYAGVEQSGPLPETIPLKPANVYGQGKLEMEQRVQALCPGAVLLRATWMYDLPGYRLPIRGNLPLNLLRAAQRGESVRFSVRDFRGITYVRQVVTLLEAALTLPGGVYNFGSENAENMVLTARQFAETLGITVDIQEADWARNLAMDCSKLRAQGIVFDTTQAGLTRCLRDYGLL